MSKSRGFPDMLTKYPGADRGSGGWPTRSYANVEERERLTRVGCGRDRGKLAVLYPPGVEPGFRREQRGGLVDAQRVLGQLLSDGRIHCSQFSRRAIRAFRGRPRSATARTMCGCG